MSQGVNSGPVCRGETYSGLILLALASVAMLARASGQELVVTRRWQSPILTIHSDGAQGNKYGFEGGRVLKINSTYHLIVT